MTEQKTRPDPAGCCGETPIQTEQGCPCSSMMKKHPRAARAICGTAGLLILPVHLGAVLGIIAFVRIHANLGKLDNARSVTAWVYRIARNAVTDHHRKKAADARIVNKMALGAAESTDDDITGRATEEFSHCIEPLLGEVPQPYREAIVLTEPGGMTRR